MQVEVYLPQKLSTTTGEVNGINYKQMFLDYLQTGEAYQVELIRKNGRYYCHITFEEDIVIKNEILYTSHNGVIGIDTNPDGLALTMIESSCRRNNIEIIKVKPQFTSKIGLYKYCHQYGMVVHNGAAMAIARRNYKFREKIPDILKEKMVSDIRNFEKKNEWSKWNEIDKKIKRKVGEKPAQWLNNRKKILGIA